MAANFFSLKKPHCSSLRTKQEQPPSNQLRLYKSDTSAPARFLLLLLLLLLLPLLFLLLLLLLLHFLLFLLLLRLLLLLPGYLATRPGHTFKDCILSIVVL